MIFENEKKILKFIKYAPSFFIVAVSVIVLTIQFIEKNSTFEKEKIKIQNEFLDSRKQLIKDRVNEVYDYIQNEKKTTEKDLKESLELAIDNAYAIANTLYQNNRDKDEQTVKKIIIDALRNIRFNSGRGYYFIYDKKGINYLLPHNKELEGKNFWNHKDSKGKYIVQEMITNLKTEDKSFSQWYWFNPLKPDIQKRKIGLVRNFEPFDWFIGTGEYIEDFEEEIQNRVLKHIKNVRFGKSGYIFVINYDSIYLSHIREEFIGKSAISNNDTVDIKNVITQIIEVAKKGEGYYTYIQNKKPGVEHQVKKTSYVKGLDEWSWMIGTGFYEDDMKKAIQDKKSELDEYYKGYLLKVIEISILLIVVLLLFSFYFSKILQRRFEKYVVEIENHISTNSRQQNLLAYQSKMAAMGEMIGNIAHQWRQPLSAISTTATGLQLQKELGMLNDEILLKDLGRINESSQYLSSTIDDFRNYFKINKEKSKFNVKDIISKSMSLIETQFKNLDIEIITDVNDIEITNYKNELLQVIINLLNNSRDELVKKDSDYQKMIFINTKINDNILSLYIKDNAGGIPEDIIDRIFEPYFTTKHQSQGTGIGLYMSHEIIIKNMEGNIEVSNQNFKYEDIEYYGAQFTITLPLFE